MAEQSEESVKQLLQSTVYALMKKDPFLGGLIQEVNLAINEACPTAYMGFDKQTLKFSMGVNPHYFKDVLKPDERVAVIEHELLHFTHMHLKRMKFTDIPDHEKKLWNIAADMSINQYISNLPKGCIDVKDWKQLDGSAMPNFRSMEEYFNLLKKSLENQQPPQKQKGQKGQGQEGQGEGEEDGEGKGEGQGKGNGKGKGNFTDDHRERAQGQQKDANGQPHWGTGPTQPNDEKWNDYKEFDQHDFDELSEEDKQKFLKEMKDTFERTIEKSQYGYSVVPGHIKDLLREIEGMVQDLDYKGILKRAIKRTVTVANREGTWKRPNKRYGSYAPGTTVGKLPKVDIHIDTSGSMSHREINEAIGIMENLMKVGAKEVNIGLWNTEEYFFKKHRFGTKFDQQEIQSGGTDVTSTLINIKKNQPALAIIITDGYMEHVDIKITTPLIWLIRADTNLNHPNKEKGITIKYSSVK